MIAKYFVRILSKWVAQIDARQAGKEAVLLRTCVNLIDVVC